LGTLQTVGFTSEIDVTPEVFSSLFMLHLFWQGEFFLTLQFSQVFFFTAFLVGFPKIFL